MRNVAICLRGIYLDRNYRHWDANSRPGVDGSSDNIQINLINKLRESFNVYIFCVCNNDSDMILVKNKYNPNHISKVSDNHSNVYIKIINQNMELFTMVRDCKVNFYSVFVTRYDVLFQHEFLHLIDYTKFNFLCHCENNHLVDDIFWVFRGDIIGHMIELCKGQLRMNTPTHNITPYEVIIKQGNMNFMFGGNFVIMNNRPLIKFSREIN
jgi:hypothetical protein